MARDSKIEVAALNLRIPNVDNRDYTALFEMIFNNRKSYQVHGDSHVVMTVFDKKQNTGIISKYTEIDVDGNWFNTNTFDVASPEDVKKIEIPPSLKPNLAKFYFYLDPEIHAVAFECYAESKSLSLKAIKKFFDHAAFEENILNKFGWIDVDIVNSHIEAVNLLSRPHIREVKIAIRRPNSDDVGDDLAAVIEERLKEQGATEYEEILKVKGDGAIRPNERTKKLATVAAENGDVVVKSVVNGVMMTEHAAQTPLIEAEKYKSDEASWPHFTHLAARVFAKIRAARIGVHG